MGGFFLNEAHFGVYESSGEIGIQIVRDFAESLPAASVEIVTRDGTAKAGLDFVAIQQTVHFEEGQTYARVPLTLIDNTLVGGDRAFTVALQNPSEGESLRSPSEAIYRVIDDESGFFLMTESSGYVGERAGYLQLNVVRNGGANLPASSVEVVTENRTAVSGADYVALHTNLTFAVGERSIFVRVPILNDSTMESEESFIVSLKNPTGGATLQPPAFLTARIFDDDRGFVVRSSETNWQVEENQPFATFVVSIDGDFTLVSPVSVTLSTTNGTARAGVDYAATNVRLVFNPDERRKEVRVPLFNNREADGPRDFRVQLSLAEGLPISDNPYESSTPIQIEDNERGYGLAQRGAFPGQPVRFRLREGTTAQLTVWREGDFDIPSAVALRCSQSLPDQGLEGTAAPGVDFPSSDRVVTFSPGENSRVVDLVLPSDEVFEATEYFFVTLHPLDESVPVDERYRYSPTPILIQDEADVPALVDPFFDLDPPLAEQLAAQTAGLLPDGRLVYVADRSDFDGLWGWTILRTLPSGRPDPIWKPIHLWDPAPVQDLLTSPEGHVYLQQQGGDLLRYLADGTQDPSFAAPRLGDNSFPMVRYPDGRLLVGETLNTPPQDYAIRRLLPTGAEDPTFKTFRTPGWIRSIHLERSGKIVLITDTFNAGGILRRLHQDGQPDPSLVSPSDPVSGESWSGFDSLHQLADGKWLAIASLGGQRPSLLRLESNGSLDPSFPIRPAVSRNQIVSAADGTWWWLREEGEYWIVGSLGWILEHLHADGTADPEKSPQSVSIPRLLRGEFFYPNPRLLSLSASELLILDCQLVNGQARHRAAKLQVPLPSRTRIVVEPSSARLPESAGIATIRLRRSGPISQALPMRWRTTPVTAVPDVDYVPAEGTVVFPAGSRDAGIQVTLINNDRFDRDRLVALEFVHAESGIRFSSAGFSVANDDLGFPAGDGIQRLEDGTLLLRPTGWIDGKTLYLQGSFQADTWTVETQFPVYGRMQEPFATFRHTLEAGSASGFFKLTDSLP